MVKKWKQWQRQLPRHWAIILISFPLYPLLSNPPTKKDASNAVIVKKKKKRRILEAFHSYVLSLSFSLTHCDSYPCLLSHLPLIFNPVMKSDFPPIYSLEDHQCPQSHLEDPLFPDLQTWVGSPPGSLHPLPGSPCSSSVFAASCNLLDR